MKHIVAAVLLLLTSAAPAFAAQGDKKFGAGFLLGDPTSLNFRYNQNEERAWDAGLAFSLSDYVLIYGNYIVKFPGVFKSEDEFIQQLTPYVGAGPLFVFANKKDHPKGSYFDKRDDSFALGARIPFGIEWMWHKFPVGIGLEIAPGIVVVPRTDGFLHGGISFRYYFN